jgi:hypothetical protein
LRTVTRKIDRNMITDQLPRLRATLLCCTVEPVEGRGQALRQARTAEQLEPAQGQLRFRASGPCAADDRQFFTICHRSILLLRRLRNVRR